MLLAHFNLIQRIKEVLNGKVFWQIGLASFATIKVQLILWGGSDQQLLIGVGEFSGP